MSERSIICLRHVATGSAYKMIWTRVAYAGIELISIPAYAKRCNARPNHFVCTSGRNARSSVYCEPALKAGSHLFCLRRVATGNVYKKIWTRVRYAGIELFLFLLRATVATRVQIISYALPVAMRRKQKDVNQP